MRLARVRPFRVSPRRSIVEFASPRSHLSFLLRLDRRAMMTFKDVSTLLRQDHQRTVVAGSWRDLDETRFLEVSEVTGARVEKTFLGVSEVASGNNAEGTDDGERA